MLNKFNSVESTKDLGKKVTLPKYHINVFHSKSDKGFIADVPDLKYCSAFGDTPDEAVREVCKAINLWLASAKADRRRIPKPRYRPAIYALAS